MALDDILQELIDEGMVIDESDSEGIIQWIYDCMRVIDANYERQKDGCFPKERMAFNSVSSIKQGIKILRSLQGKTSVATSSLIQVNVNQSQNQSSTAIAQNQLSLQINLNIDNSVDLTKEQKQAAKELYTEVETEVQKDKPNWPKVTELLKKSLEYGLKVAPDIIRLAEAYYKAKL